MADPIYRISTAEFQAKIEEAVEDRRAAIAQAEADCARRLALIDINYYGPNWLTTGKVGGWTEES